MRRLHTRCRNLALTALAGCLFLTPTDRLLAHPTEPDTHDATLEVREGGAWRDIDDHEDVSIETGRGVVLLIHGLDEPGSIWDVLAPALTSAGYQAVRFDYPNDQAIAASADELDHALSRLKDAGASEITIVAHSMGGLVAMDALSRENVDDERRPRVARLITLGTPAKGAALAPLQPLLELREQAIRMTQDGRITRRELGAHQRDGQGEAGRDLTPGSAFLEELWSREAPRDLRMTAIIARAGRLDGDEIERTILKNLPAPVSQSPEARGLTAGFARWATRSAEELASAIGDGVVSTESASETWTDDIVVVHAHHRSMVTDAPCPIRGDNEPPAIRVILDRLAADRDESSR